MFLIKFNNITAVLFHPIFILVYKIQLLPLISQKIIIVVAYFVAGTDIGKFTMKTIDDIRTMNKIVHFRPPANHLNINELACLWEKKIKRTLPRRIISESDLLLAASGYESVYIVIYINFNKLAF